MSVSMLCIVHDYLCESVGVSWDGRATHLAYGWMVGWRDGYPKMMWCDWDENVYILGKNYQQENIFNTEK